VIVKDIQDASFFRATESLFRSAQRII